MDEMTPEEKLLAEIFKPTPGDEEGRALGLLEEFEEREPELTSMRAVAYAGERLREYERDNPGQTYTPEELAEITRRFVQDERLRENDYVEQTYTLEELAEIRRFLREDGKIKVEVPTLPPATPARAALETPYTLAQWRSDLHTMAAGIPTGFDVLEDVGMQWLPGKLTAIIARPGGGKTQFLLEACARFLENNPTQHAVFLSWEEPLADVVVRLLQRADARRTRRSGGFPDRLTQEMVRHYGRGEKLTPDLTRRMEAALADVDALLLRLRLVDGDEIGREVHHTLAELGEWMREPNAPRVGLVAVDYFQKLRGKPDAHSRLHELQDVSDTLRRFAKGARLSGASDADTFEKAFAVPVLVGAQVNRTSAQSISETGHPTGDSIREGDDLLNDAAAVVALSWANAPAGEAMQAGTVETVRWLRISVPKHRGGRTRGTFGDEVARVLWHPGRMWIADKCQRRENGTVAWDAPERPDTVKSDAAAGVAPTAASLLKGRT